MRFQVFFFPFKEQSCFTALLKNELYVKNWHPITLLWVDLKIWSKCISNRLETVTNMIGCQQNGFIKHRSIFNNILTTMEVVSFMRKNKRAGVFLIIF